MALADVSPYGVVHISNSFNQGSELESASISMSDIPALIAELQAIKKKANLEGPASPWHPMTGPAIDLKHLEKLGEECCELGQVIFRCLMQGLDECEPVTKKPNRQWLIEEIADVMANIDLVTAHFQLDVVKAFQRSQMKKRHLKTWHEQA